MMGRAMLLRLIVFYVERESTQQDQGQHQVMSAWNVQQEGISRLQEAIQSRTALSVQRGNTQRLLEPRQTRHVKSALQENTRTFKGKLPSLIVASVLLASILCHQDQVFV